MMSPLQPRTLDHVAFWVAERDPIVERCIGWLGMHVIDRQESFTLLGAERPTASSRCLTHRGHASRGCLGMSVFVSRDLAAARARLPPRTPELFDLGEGILARLVGGPQRGRDRLRPRVAQLSRSRRRRGRLRAARTASRDGARFEVGGASIELEPGAPVETARPLLNHLARAGGVGRRPPARSRARRDRDRVGGRSSEHARRLRLGPRPECGSSTSSTSRRSRSSEARPRQLTVAGGGMAGLVAAARARRARRPALLYEKGERLGGSMLLSSGVIWRHREWEEFRRECPAGDGLQRRCGSGWTTAWPGSRARGASGARRDRQSAYGRYALRSGRAARGSLAARLGAGATDAPAPLEETPSGARSLRPEGSRPRRTRGALHRPGGPVAAACQPLVDAATVSATRWATGRS